MTMAGVHIIRMRLPVHVQYAVLEVGVTHLTMYIGVGSHNINSLGNLNEILDM